MKNIKKSSRVRFFFPPCLRAFVPLCGVFGILLFGCLQPDLESAEAEKHDLEIRMDGKPIRVIDIDPNAATTARVSLYDIKTGQQVSYSNGVSASSSSSAISVQPSGVQFSITGIAGSRGIVTFTVGEKSSMLRVFVRNWNADQVFRHRLSADVANYRFDPAVAYNPAYYPVQGSTTPTPPYTANKLAAYRLVVDTGFHYEAPDGISRRLSNLITDQVHADVPRETETRKIHDVPHIIQINDSDYLPADVFQLNKDVFKFILHFLNDGDMVGGYDDRQRLEIKTMDNTWPPDNPESSPTFDSKNKMYSNGGGDTFTHRWKFRLPSNFIVSSEYTHIHQIKPEGGDSGNPTFTLTGRKLRTGREVLQLIYRGPIRANEDPSVNWYPCEVDLEPFKGEWVYAEETVTYDNPGAYHLRLTRIRDMRVLMEYIYSPEQYDEFDPFVMFRKGNTYIRPKFGVYRRIMHMSPFGLPDPTDPVVEYRAENNELVVLYADIEMDKLKR